MLYSCSDRSMDQSEFDIGAADLPQRGSRSQALVRVIEAALPPPLVRRARHAIVAGNLLHGVLDARGRTPGKRVQGARGRLRLTLVVNYWDRRPSGVPTWTESGVYRGLG